jgi:glycosyltransferase involved in cell wall biosynthesis
VIVPSTSTRDDLVRLHGAEPERIDVIPHGTDAHAFVPSPAEDIAEARSRFGVEGPYVLFVGGIEPRKNLEALVRAFAMVDTDAALVLVGGPVGAFPDETRRLEAAIAELPAPARDRVIRTGYVTQRHKRALLTDATALACPSLHEGFGLPVLEAFAASVPVLASTASSLPEVAGDAALLVDPHDAIAIAAGLHQLLEDADLREVLRAAGMARATAFTWERSARSTAATLRRAVEEEG